MWIRYHFDVPASSMSLFVVSSVGIAEDCKYSPLVVNAGPASLISLGGASGSWSASSGLGLSLVELASST